MNGLVPSFLVGAALCMGGGVAIASDAEELMNEVLARYQALESYGHEATQDMKVEFEGGMSGKVMGAGGDGAVAFTYDNTGRFSLTGSLIDLYADGQGMTAHVPATDEYMRIESGADASFADLPVEFGMMIPSQNPVASILVDRPESFDQSGLRVQAWGKVSEKKIKGRSGRLVSCTLSSGMPGMGPSEALIWIDDKTGLIGRIEIDMLEQMTAMGEDQMGGMVPTVFKQIISYDKVTADGPVDNEIFAFTPDDDDELVETLPSMQEIMTAMMGGMGGGLGGPMGDAPEAGGPPPGFPAPAFAAQTLDGEPVSLADLKGKVVLLDFWATWCAPCIQGMPAMQALHEKYGDKGLVVIGVSIDSSNMGDKVRTLVGDKGLTFSMIHNADGEIAKSYGVGPIPHSVLIGPDGTIQAAHIGFAPGMEATYSEEIEKLLKGEKLADI